MEKKKGFAFLAYGIPWVFLMLYGDAVYRWAWQYVLIISGMAVLAWLGVNTGGMLLAGNALSLGTTVLCVHLFGFAAQDHYFKPFGAFGWVIVLTLFSALIQWLVWKKQWLALGLLAALVGSLAGCAFWLQASL